MLSKPLEQRSTALDKLGAYQMAQIFFTLMPESLLEASSCFILVQTPGSTETDAREAYL